MNCFSEKVNKINNCLARLIKKHKKTNKIKNEREDIVTAVKSYKGTWDYYE